MRRNNAITRTVALSMAVALASATMSLSAPTLANAATPQSVSDAQSEFNKAAQTYNDACTKAEQAKSDADAAEQRLAKAKADASNAMRKSYKERDNGAVGAVAAIMSTGSISDGVRELAAWQELSSEYAGNIANLVNDKAVADKAKADADAAVTQAKADRDKADETYNAAIKAQETARKKAAAAAAASTSASSSSVANASAITENAASSGAFLTVAQMKSRGVVYYNGWKFTYYSQQVLPGNGLKIPGRHVANGAVCDIDGYICVASSTLAKGTVVSTPVGPGKVYDSGCAANVIDIYTA